MSPIRLVEEQTVGLKTRPGVCQYRLLHLRVHANRRPGIEFHKPKDTEIEDQ